MLEALGPDLFKAGEESLQEWNLHLGIAKEWSYSHRYRGWLLHWLTGANTGAVSAFDEFDTKTLEFKLKAQLVMSVGDRFAYFPEQANWLFHHNTISDCAEPVVLDSYGSDTSLFTDNIIARGLASGVKTALTVKGNFTVARNVVAGFNEPGCIALRVEPDPFGKTWETRCSDNLFRACTSEVVVIHQP